MSFDSTNQQVIVLTDITEKYYKNVFKNVEYTDIN